MTTLITLSKLSLMAMQYLGVPYVWGGDNPKTGFDCSGFVQRALADCNMYAFDRDRTSQTLYHYFKSRGLRSGIETDSVLFFGKDVDHITHIAIALNDELMIEAGGGDSSTTQNNTHLRSDARVRIKPINLRSDLVASLVIK